MGRIIQRSPLATFSHILEQISCKIYMNPPMSIHWVKSNLLIKSFELVRHG